MIGRVVVVGAFVGLFSGAASAQLADLDQVERDAATAAAEMDRLGSEYREIPSIFVLGDREDRSIWGSIYHLNKEYERASLALFGAVEPREGEAATAVTATPTYAESLFFLADSLYELGNVGAAQQYFEKLLTLRGHDFYDDAILRLMGIAADAGHFDEVDRYYNDYLAIAGNNVPGQVRYLHAKSLFRGGRNEGALQELAKIPTADAFDLRARYLRAAIFTKEDKLKEALAVFDEVLKLKNISRQDADVKELANLGRGRLLYELDRLDESIDAYQEIDFDSKYLTSMLYEVTLTYVRRGQIALRGKKGDGKTDAEKRALARIEYKKALRQLDDLRALDPDGERSADIDLLAGNLRLQRLEFDDAEHIFGEVLEKHSTADLELQKLIGDTSLRALLLKDIMALESDPHAILESPLPPIAARRAARNKAVAQSLAVFKDIRKSRADVEAAQRLLDQLDGMLDASNASRAELFQPLRSAVERSVSVSNSVASMREHLLDVERKLSRPSSETRAALDAAADKRQTVQAKIAQLPTTPDAVAARKTRLKDRVDADDRELHELELLNERLRASLASVDWLSQQDTGNPAQRDLMRARVRQAQEELVANEAAAVSARERLTALRTSLATVGGRGSAEEQLRADLSQSFVDERTLLASARDPGQAQAYRRIDALVEKLEAVTARNSEFREKLDRGVEDRLAGARTVLAAERDALATYGRALDAIDVRAAGVRDGATAVALERVRADLSRIVLRADVGIVDSAFARKQTETDTISALQKARAGELTDLTQAYADLTRDELP